MSIHAIRWAIVYLAIAGTCTLAQDTGLPSAAQKALDLKHPGWKLADISKENRDICFNPKSGYEPSLVWGDFDGDGQKDYAALIFSKGRTAVVILLKRKEAYLVSDVFSTSKPEERGPELLGLIPKGGAYAHESVVAQYCESSSIAFSYTNTGFKRKILGD
jgi:hypothetical protein